jgi:type IV secretory pathway TrbD component
MARSPWGTDKPEGFEIPIYRTPLKPALALGVPMEFTAFTMGAAILGFLWKAWALLILAMLLHVLAAWGTRKDEKWFTKILRVVRYKRYYKA